MTNRQHYTITFHPDGSFTGVPSERGGGSGATSCFADREASGRQDRAEDEGAQRPIPKELAVSPGEAVAEAFVEFRRRLDAKAAEYMTKHSTTSQMAVMTLRAHYLEMAAAFRGMSFATLFDEPQPDSEQSENVGDGKQSQESPEANADPNHGTASGRRTRR